METKLPIISTTLPGPEARKILALDKQYVSPSYTRDYPLVAKSGKGAIVEDVDGNFFLDFAAGIAVVSTGHCHPEIVKAIHKQSETLIHMSGTDFYYPLLAQLGEKLSQVAPGNFAKKVAFGNSGAEAIEAALKLARYATKRHRFIAFLGSFHGRTMGALSLTASKAAQRRGFGDLVPGVVHVAYPNPYRCPQGHQPDECKCDDVQHHGLYRKAITFRPFFRRMRSPELWLSRFRVRVAVRHSTQGISGKAAAALRPARHPAHLRRGPKRGMGRTGKNVGRAITKAWRHDIMVSWRRASLSGCRSASPWHALN